MSAVLKNVLIAVTRPELLPIVAMPVLLLIHVPPPVASLRVVVEPEQTLSVPLIGGGGVLTVMGIVAIQPVPKV
jgi:hypothetical protein